MPGRSLFTHAAAHGGTGGDAPSEAPSAEQQRALSRDLNFGDIVTVDVGDCQVTEIRVGLYEHEATAPPAHRTEAWPPRPLQLIDREIEAFAKRRPDRVVRLISTAMTEEFCVLVLHHAARR